jgi:hypothetical protein
MHIENKKHERSAPPRRPIPGFQPDLHSPIGHDAEIQNRKKNRRKFLPDEKTPDRIINYILTSS